MDALQALDCRLFLRVNGIGSGDAWLMLVGWGTELGHGGVIALLLALGLRWADPRRFPKNWLLIALGVAIGGLASQAIKSVTARPRPAAAACFAAAPEPAVTRSLAGGLPLREYTVGAAGFADEAPSLRVIGPRLRHRSFPSGHTAAAFAAAAGLIYAFRGRRRLLWLLPAGFVGWTRIACGVHFPGDVLAGAAIGSGAAIAFLRGFESFHGLATRPQPAPTSRVGSGPLRFLFVAGEASADRYGARVLGALREFAPDARAGGIGGARMQEAGLACFGASRDLEVIGVTAVLTRLPGIVRLYRRALRALRVERPDVLVCIDLPDFNFMLAQQARALGIPVLFYVSPQLWAWRSRRVDKLADRISHMVVAFPFESAYYERAGVPVSFHGHPLLEDLPAEPADRTRVLAQLDLDPARRTVVLAPGSRGSEWRHHGELLFEAARELSAAMPELQFVLPLAPDLPEPLVRDAAARAGLPLRIARRDVFDVLAASDLGLLCSGTLTLEAALAGLPMVVFYRMNGLNAAIARHWVEIDRFALPNIVLGGPRPVFPERIQERATPAGLAAEARRILQNPLELAELKQATGEVRRRLRGGETSRAVAEEILRLVPEPR